MLIQWVNIICLFLVDLRERINCNQRVIATELVCDGNMNPFFHFEQIRGLLHTYYASFAHQVEGLGCVFHVSVCCFRFNCRAFRCFLMAILVAMSLYCSSNIDPCRLFEPRKHEIPLNLVRFFITNFHRKI